MTAPNQSPAIYYVAMCICGIDNYIDVDLVRQPTNDRAQELAILHELNAEEEEFFLLWHFEDEACAICRPFGDLYPGNPTSCQGFDQKIIHLHPHRHKDANGPIVDQNAQAGKPRASDETEGPAAAPEEEEEEEEEGYIDDARKRAEIDGTQSDDDLSTKRDVLETTNTDTAFRLSWSSDTCEQFGLTGPTGPTITLRADQGPRDLRAKVREAVIQMLSDVQDINTRLAGIRAVFFDTTLNMYANDWRPVNMDEQMYGDRLSTVPDFYLDPTNNAALMEGTIHLRLDAGSLPKKRETSKAFIPAENLAMLVRNVLDDDGHDFIRVGETVAKSKENEDDESDDDVATEFPIVAETDQKKLVGVWKSQGWDLDDHCIGGFHMRKENIPCKKAYLWWTGFEGVKNRPELHKRIFDNRVAPGPRMPFMPPMTFNQFKPKACRPRLKTAAFGKNLGLIVLVNSIGHLDQAERPWPSLVRIFQTITGDDTMDSGGMTTEILAGIRKHDKIKALFGEELKGRWQMHLWAMPQKPAPQKLFRFRTLDGDHDLLRNFVTQQSVGKGHLNVYMEAHFWPADGADQPLAQSKGKSNAKATLPPPTKGKKRKAPFDPPRAPSRAATAKSTSSKTGKKSKAKAALPPPTKGKKRKASFDPPRPPPGRAKTAKPTSSKMGKKSKATDDVLDEDFADDESDQEPADLADSDVGTEEEEAVLQKTLKKSKRSAHVEEERQVQRAIENSLLSRDFEHDGLATKATKVVKDLTAEDMLDPDDEDEDEDE